MCVNPGGLNLVRTVNLLKPGGLNLYQTGWAKFVPNRLDDICFKTGWCIYVPKPGGPYLDQNPGGP